MTVASDLLHQHIQSLVDDSEKAELGMGDLLLGRRFGQPLLRAAEMYSVHTARKTMHASVTIFFRVIKAGAAREDQVCTREQLLLTLQ